MHSTIDGCGRKLGLLATVSLIPLLLSSALAQAQDATWIGTGAPPADWNAPANWSPTFVPSGTAFFDSSLLPTTSINIPGARVGGLNFTGAPGYTFNVSGLTLNGAGIVADSSSVAPIFNITGFMGLLNSASFGPSQVTVNGGANLVLLNTASAGSAVIANNGTFTFQDTSTAGTANITNSVPGQIFFKNASSAGSSTIDNSAVVFFQNTSTAGKSSITTQANGFTLFGDTSSAGTSQQTVQAGGSLQFNDKSTADNSTIVNSSIGPFQGGVQFNNNSTAGSANITNNAAASIFFGGGGLGSASAGNATIDNFGNVVFLNSSTAGNATITTEAGANTQFAGTSNGGSSKLIVNAGGTVGVLLGFPSIFTVGSVAGSLGGQINFGGNTLVVGSDNTSTTYGGLILGSGGFEKVGTGTLNLTGALAASGPVSIAGGTLNVVNPGGVFNASSVFVDTNGTLSGNGTVSTLGGTVTVNGTLAPGNGAPGALTINTPGLFFNPTSIYQVSFYNTVNTIALVNGVTALDGTLRVRTDSSSVLFNTPYQVLASSGGVNSQFAALDLQSTLKGTVTYNPNNVLLTFAPNISGGAQGLGAGKNQQAVANAIQNGLASASSPGAFAPLFALSGANLLTALSQLSGEVATGASTSTFQSMGSFLNIMLDPTLDNRGGLSGRGPSLAFAPDTDEFPSRATAYAGKQKISDEASQAFASVRRPVDPITRYNGWATAYGDWSSLDGNAKTASSSISTRSGGMAAGFDVRPSPGVVLGGAVGGSTGNYSLGNGLGNGDVNMFQAGLYGSLTDGFLYGSAALAFGLQSVSTKRTVPFAPSDQLSASFDAHSFSGRFEFGSRFGSATSAMSPFVALQVQQFDAPAYSERATGAAVPFALSYSSSAINQMRSELGVWYDAKISNSPTDALVLRAKVAWAHQFNDAPAMNAAFATFPSIPFTVTGAVQDRDSLLTAVAAEYRLNRNLAVNVRFDGDFGAGGRAFGGQGGVRYTW